MSERLAELFQATALAVLRGPGSSPPELRQAVSQGQAPEDLRALVEKIRRCAYTIRGEDLEALRNRRTEDEIFEIVVAAAWGAADLRLAAGLRALEEA